MTAFSGSEEEEEDGRGGEAERREGENSAHVEQTSPHTDSGGSLDARLVWGVGGEGEGGGGDGERVRGGRGGVHCLLPAQLHVLWMVSLKCYIIPSTLSLV